MSDATIESLIWALERVIDSTNEHDKAREAYDGCSWGYAGAGLIYERDQARKDFGDRLNALIDARIAERLGLKDGPA